MNSPDQRNPRLPPIEWHALGCVLILLMTVSTQATVTYEVLHSFQKPGTQVVAPLLLHSDGNFYGVASANGALGMGTVFKMTPTGTLTTLFAFDDTNGAGPTAKLVEGSDNVLYGTASSGGANGFGVAFKVTTSGTFTKLVDFTGTSGSARGSVPHGLMLHADGDFYGVTQGGGTSGFGTVFKMTSTGVVTTLVDFTGSTGTRPGSEPMGPLVASGTLLYGVTKLGGTAGLGVIYEVSATGTWRSLGEFSGTAGTHAGSNPAGGLFFNANDGALYGTTEFGGTNSFGVAFKITTAASTVYTVLRHFADLTGSQPTGTLVSGTDGLLYGATALGGSSGLGTLYKITTTGTHTVLANFTGETGAVPGSSMRGGLTVGADSAFYGLSSAGASGNLGSFFKVTSAGVFTALSSLSLSQGWMPSGAPVASGTGSLLFPVAAGGSGGGGNVMSVTATGSVSVAAALGGTLGSYPDGALRAAGSTFYGVTAKGGTSARGTTYRYTIGSGASLVVAHTTSGGSLAEGSLVLGADGLYYGVGREGGASSRGAIFKVTTAGVRTRIVSLTGTAGAAPGGRPHGPLVLAADGHFYGLTEDGGSANTGVILRLTSTGVYTALYHFAATGARSPQGGFVIGNDGLLYATTSAGGTADQGALIRFNPTTSAVTVVGEFTGTAGAAPGSLPAGELLVGSDGAIYGLALLGGAAGEGAVFRYTSSGGLETLVQFTGASGAAPGSAADTDGAGLIVSGGLAFGSDGLLYGVASGGGASGGGVVFRLSTSQPINEWKLTYLGDANAPDQADSDNDALPNILEYALLSNPSVSDARSLPPLALTTFPDDTRLSMVVPRDPLRSDIIITVEVSDTLLPGSWSIIATSTHGGVFTGPGYYSGDSASAGVKSVTIRDTQSASVATRRFMRVGVTR